MNRPSSKVELRPIAETDLIQMLRWRNSPDIYKWCRQFEPISWHEHKRWFDSLSGNTKIKMYAIVDQEQALIGVCGLTDIDFINRRAEVSLYINPELQGCGYGETSFRALCAHAFRKLNLNCLWGESFEGSPAIKLFKRVGFKEDGKRRSFYYRDGKYVGATLFSLLRGEYA